MDLPLISITETASIAKSFPEQAELPLSIVPITARNSILLLVERQQSIGIIHGMTMMRMMNNGPTK
jgi:hypothetical protein